MNFDDSPDVDNKIIKKDTTITLQNRSSKDLILFFSLKIITMLLFFLSTYPIPTEIPITLILISGMIEFWVTKNVNGLKLVGMRWSHEIGDIGEPFFYFYARPDPYVPEQKESNLFYFGLFVAVIIWIIFFILSLLFFHVISIILSLILISLESFNLICFLKCSQISMRQADDIARSVIFHDSINTPESTHKNDILVPLTSETDHLEIDIQE